MRVEHLLALDATVASGHGMHRVLDAIVRGPANVPGVALARIWLLAPGDT
ncbi:MAG TPA: hypothetical protein VMJ93_13060 [Verrucomicrobiae bacterium]|nr:hypothetical protein [Verrucomicrobiae bacterium]